MKKCASLLLCLFLLIGLCACGNDDRNNASGKTNRDDETKQAELSVTEKRLKLLDNLNGVVEIDVPTFKSYFSTIYSPCYICGKVTKVEYDEDEDTYTYRIRDEEYYVYIWIEDCEEKFEEGDTVYIDCSMGDKSKVEKSKNGSIGTQKDDLNYMSVKTYQDIFDKLESLYFKVAGYVFVETEEFGGKTYYDYYLYASEKDYGKEDAEYISLGFDTPPENIMGKKRQIMGQHKPDADTYVPTLVHCSIVD